MSKLASLTALLHWVSWRSRKSQRRGREREGEKKEFKFDVIKNEAFEKEIGLFVDRGENPSRPSRVSIAQRGYRFSALLTKPLETENDVGLSCFVEGQRIGNRTGSTALTSRSDIMFNLIDC